MRIRKRMRLWKRKGTKSDETTRGGAQGCGKHERPAARAIGALLRQRRCGRAFPHHHNARLRRNKFRNEFRDKFRSKSRARIRQSCRPSVSESRRLRRSRRLRQPPNCPVSIRVIRVSESERLRRPPNCPVSLPLSLLYAAAAPPCPRRAAAPCSRCGRGGAALPDHRPTRLARAGCPSAGRKRFRVPRRRAPCFHGSPPMTHFFCTTGAGRT